jgi:hypothetical protein
LVEEVCFVGLQRFKKKYFPFFLMKGRRGFFFSGRTGFGIDDGERP